MPQIQIIHVDLPIATRGIGIVTQTNTDEYYVHGSKNIIKAWRLGPGVIKPSSSSTRLSTKFQLVIKTKIKTFPAFEFLDDVLSKLTNVKMPTVADILTFMSMINFMHI